jgi:predicted permease
VLLGLSTLLIDVPAPYLVQAAMPTGVNTLVVAHAYGLDRRIAAGAIAWTTTIVVCVGVVAALV